MLCDVVTLCDSVALCDSFTGDESVEERLGATNAVRVTAKRMKAAAANSGTEAERMIQHRLSLNVFLASSAFLSV